jgi:hypothetical protein
MSTIEQLRKNFEYSSNTEPFNQIPQSRPFRRNQSQQYLFNNLSPYNANKNVSNNIIPIQEKILPKNITVTNQPKALTKNKSSLDIKNNGFNPKNHIPPKYDIYGYLRPFEKRKEDMAILEEKDKIKIPWSMKNTNKSGAMTRSDLIKIRRKEKLPDPSYDLDKDGYVGNVDLVLSKRFDVDNDGKLNEKEKQAAYEGIEKGVENEYCINNINKK